MKATMEIFNITLSYEQDRFDREQRDSIVDFDLKIGNIIPSRPPQPPLPRPRPTFYFLLVA